jgi:hypothetical protein
MFVSDRDLASMVMRLDAMAVKFHALPDGKGIYLGDGHPYPVGQELRSATLASVLRECIAWRARFLGRLAYDAAVDSVSAIV